jgi:hypothetical protein
MKSNTITIQYFTKVTQHGHTASRSLTPTESEYMIAPNSVKNNVVNSTALNITYITILYV